MDSCHKHDLIQAARSVEVNMDKRIVQTGCDPRNDRIQSNLNRYRDWECRQNHLMDQTISDISEVFESMNYCINHQIYRESGKEADVQQRGYTGVSGSQKHKSNKRLKLRKLASLFVQNTNGQILSDDNAEMLTFKPVPETIETMHRSENKHYSYSAHKTLRKLQAIDSNTSEMAIDKHEKYDSISNTHQNLLGIPPPSFIQPALNTSRSASTGMEHNKQDQILLHDLITGDICDTPD